jgi:hypothetical protein
MASPVFVNWTPFSATPQFSFSPGAPRSFKMFLTGDVTSSTVLSADLPPGSRITFMLQQDAVGGRAFAWPANFLGAQPIANGPNQTTKQVFTWDGINFHSDAIPQIF